MKRICVDAGSRAEFGLLLGLMEEIRAQDVLELQVAVTGMHLSPEFGGREPHSVEIFLEYVGLSEDEFNQIVAQVAIPSHRLDFATVRWARKPADYGKCYLEGKR